MPAQEARKVRRLVADSEGTRLGIATQSGAFLWDTSSQKYDQLTQEACEDMLINERQVWVVQPCGLQRETVTAENAKPVVRSKLLLLDRESQQVLLQQDLEMNVHKLVPLKSEKVAITLHSTELT